MQLGDSYKAVAYMVCFCVMFLRELADPRSCHLSLVWVKISPEAPRLGGGRGRQAVHCVSFP